MRHALLMSAILASTTLMAACGAAPMAADNSPTVNVTTFGEGSLVTYTADAVEHPGAGVTSPSTILGVRLDHTLQNDLLGYDHSAHYVSEQLIVSLYVYPWSNDACDRTLEDHAALFTHDFEQQVRGRWALVGGGMSADPFPDGEAWFFTTVMTGLNVTEFHDEAVAVWKTNGWYVKVRVTMERNPGVTPIEFMRLLVQDMTWPDFSRTPAPSLTQEENYGLPSSCGSPAPV